jgi:hypothetical protein
LARAAEKIAFLNKEPAIVVCQRTAAELLNELGDNLYVVKKKPGYEGSEEVTDQAAEIFHTQGITEVIPVAQPILHLWKCIRLVRKAGFKTPGFWKLAFQIGWIGFDKESVQPATTSLLGLLIYTVRQILFGYRPPIEQSEP